MDALTPPQVTECGYLVPSLARLAGRQLSASDYPPITDMSDFIALGQTKARQAYLVTFFKSWQAGWMVSCELPSLPSFPPSTRDAWLSSSTRKATKAICTRAIMEMV